MAHNDCKALHEALGLAWEPLGVFYTDRRPEGGVAPKPDRFGCSVGLLRRAREKGIPAWFSAERPGCPGAAYFFGFQIPQAPFLAEYISKSEGYLKTPDSAEHFYKVVAARPAPAEYCVFKPLSLFSEGEKPEVVVYCDTPEAVSGLHQLAVFSTGDLNAVVSPFGSGCSNISAWPLQFAGKGEPKAVLGGWDPSCRPYLGLDEISFAVPYAVHQDMVRDWPDSFLAGKAWAKVRRRMERKRSCKAAAQAL